LPTAENPEQAINIIIEKMTKISLHIALFTSALAILSIFACQDSFIYKEKRAFPITAGPTQTRWST
jgi:hypothetical protein